MDLTKPPGKAVAVRTTTVAATRKTVAAVKHPAVVKTGRFLFDDILWHWMVKTITGRMMRTVFGFLPLLGTYLLWLVKGNKDLDMLAMKFGVTFIPPVLAGIYMWFEVPHRWLYALITLTVLALAIYGGGKPYVPRVRPEPEPQAPDGMSDEEGRLCRRMDRWEDEAPQRGLEGTAPGDTRVAEYGLETPIHLDGKWTIAALAKDVDKIGSFLGIKRGTRIRIIAGPRADVALLCIHTRNATDGQVLRWSPGAAFGIDSVTGKDVRIPLGIRALVAGASGAGKTWSTRSMLWSASEGPTNRLVIIDLKRVEGRLWDHRARVATTPQEVLDLVAELVEEMGDRLDSVPKGTDTITPSADRPRITVFVDEGAEVMIKVKDSIEDLESIARIGRAACIDLVWCTQYPTIGDGIPKQINPQLVWRIGLGVDNPMADRVIFGEGATLTGWLASELPMPGWALVRGSARTSAPNPIQVRTFDNDAVMNAVPTPIWHRGGGVAVNAASARAAVMGLLRDAVTVTRATGEDRISTRDLLNALEDLRDEYGDLSANALTAALLSAGVERGQDRIRIGGERLRGWLLEDLTRAAQK